MSKKGALDLRRIDFSIDDVHGPSTYEEIDKLFQNICRETSRQRKSSENVQSGTKQEVPKSTVSIPLARGTSIENHPLTIPKTALKKSNLGSMSARGKREMTPKNNKVTWPQSLAKELATKNDLGDGNYDENQNQYIFLLKNSAKNVIGF